MKIAALLASALVATAVQASQVTLYYCQEDGNCFDALVETDQCTALKHPGYLKSIANTGDCELFRFPGCGGRSNFVPRGTNLLQSELVVSVRCYEPGLSRNLAPAVQASQVDVEYCLENGPCTKASVEPYQCMKVVPHPGYLSSIQNTADCKLFEFPGCGGRVKEVARGSHDSSELRNKFVGSYKCSEPGLPQNLAPAVQASDVIINYCITNGPCIDQYVAPYKCTDLDVPGPISSIQNTADCELFSYPGCGGRSIPVRRGSNNLKNPIVETIRCSEPGFQRNQRPMRML